MGPEDTARGDILATIPLLLVEEEEVILFPTYDPSIMVSPDWVDVEFDVVC